MSLPVKTKLTPFYLLLNTKKFFFFSERERLVSILFQSTFINSLLDLTHIISQTNKLKEKAFVNIAGKKTMVNV